MRKCLIVIIFGCISASLSAQTYRNYVLGRYYGTFVRLNSSNQIVQNCAPGVLEFIISNACSDCVYELDSTDCAMSQPNWSGEGWDINVYPDTTLINITPCGSYCANGQLYSNDSLVIKYKEGSLTFFEEFHGMKLYSTVGLQQLSLPSNELLLSPNPANDLLHIQSTQITFTNAPLIYDIRGQQINVTPVYVNANTYKLDVSNLSAGIYFMFVQSNGVYIKKKFVVQH